MLTIVSKTIGEGWKEAVTRTLLDGVGKKFYADAICLTEISKQVAERTGACLGELNMIIASLHSYESDWRKIRELFDLR